MDWCVDPSVAGWRQALERDLAAHLARRVADQAPVETAMRQAAVLLDRILEDTPAPHRVTLSWGDDGAGSLHLRLLDGAAPGAPLPGVAIGPGASASPWGPGDPAPAAADVAVAALGVVRPAEAAMDPDVGPVRLPSGRDRFLTALVAMGSQLQGLGPEEACAFAGAAASHRAEEEHRHEGGTAGPLDARGVAEAFVAYQRTIGGDFEIDEASAREAVVSNHTCPFGPAVVGSPHLCRVTSAMLGSMAAKCAGEAVVRLDERLAVGDRRCRLVLRLGPATGPGVHRYRWPPAGITAAAPPGADGAAPPAAPGPPAPATRPGPELGPPAPAAPSVSLTLRLLHDRDGVPLARHVVRESLAAIDVTSGVIDDIELALSEACTNVLRHAGPGDAYEVVLHVRAGRCEVQVTDHGQGFDLASVRKRRPGGQSERGRGLAIMEGVMDAVEVVSRPGQGSRVTLVKQLAFTPGSAVRHVLGAPTPDP